MIKSMTAYAVAERADETLLVSFEMRGYNSRYLDIALKMPNTYAALEDKLRRAVSEKAIRGRHEDASLLPGQGRNGFEMCGAQFRRLRNLVYARRSRALPRHP